MAITYQPAGQGQLISGLATAAAGAKAAREERQRQFQMQMMQMDQQLELERFARQKSWETEKMELASRLDFERSEKKRLAELDEMDSRIKSVVDAVDKGLIDGNEADREQMKVKLKTMLTLQQMGDHAASAQLAKQIFPESRYGFAGVGKIKPGEVTPQEPVTPMKILGQGQIDGVTKYQLQVPVGDYIDIINVDPTDQVVIRDKTGNQAVVSMNEYKEVYEGQGWVVDSLSGQVAKRVQERKAKLTPGERGVEAIERGISGAGGLLQAIGGKALSAFERGAPPTQTPFAGPPSIHHKKVSEAVYGAFPRQGDLGGYVKKDWERFVKKLANDPALYTLGIKKEQITSKMKRWAYMTEDQIKMTPEFKKLPDRLKNYTLTMVEEFQAGLPKIKSAEVD